MIDTDGWGFKLPLGSSITLEKDYLGAWTANLLSNHGGGVLATATQPRLVGLVQTLLEAARKAGVIP